MTLLDALVVIVVIAAAIGGFRRLGGSGRAGGLLGLLVGAGVGSVLGAWLAGLGTDGASVGFLRVTGVVVGLVLGATVGGVLGRALSRVLIAGRLAALDRVAGAVAGAASALLVMWLLAVVVPVVVGPQALEPVTSLLAAVGGHSAVIDAVCGAVPAPVRGTVDGVLAAVNP